MPRQKVRPEDRQRSSRACQACKASKIRCNAQHPCLSCIRRDKAHTCVYSNVDRRRRGSNILSTRQHDSMDPLRGSGVQGNIIGSGYTLDNPFSEPVTPHSNTDSNENIQAPVFQGSVLKNVPSDKVYVGEISSLSFLHFLRKTVRAYVGSVAFTDSEHHTLLETDFEQSVIEAHGVSPDKMDKMLGSYFEATSGILNLFTNDEIRALMTERSISPGVTSQPRIRREDTAALDLALAIGAQIEGDNEDQNIAKGYFCRARQIAFEDMLMGQSLSTARLFLLMAFYMLGACHRNAASMFLAVATKAAVNLNLQSPINHGNLSTKDFEQRQRVWNSIRNIDILGSFILGKPKNLPSKQPSLIPTVIGTDEETHALPTFHATGQACNILEDIAETLSKDNLLHVPTAERLLERLRQWSRDLPPGIRRFSHVSASQDGDLKSADRQALVGSMHVSCVYYFAVILITRPYLIAYLTSRLRGKAPDQLISDPDEASDINIKNNKVSKLAQVCVSSAIYMVEMCQRAKASGFDFGNLCLLKSWLFGAGLVLGFSMFAGEPRRDIENSFDGARSVLDNIGGTSPQARLYHEILTTFSEAVVKYHSRVAGEVHRTVEHYMEKIFVIDNPLDVSRANSHQPNVGSSMANNGWHDEWDSSSLETMDLTGNGPSFVSHTARGVGVLQMGEEWQGFDMLSDSLFPDTEPFDQFFYTVE